jgi:hypothetical protein
MGWITPDPAFRNEYDEGHNARCFVSEGPEDWKEREARQAVGLDFCNAPHPRYHDVRCGLARAHRGDCMAVNDGLMQQLQGPIVVLFDGWL